MEEEDKVTLETTEEEVEETEQAPSETTDTEEDADIRYLQQKKRAEKAEAELKALRENGKQPAKPKEAQKPITSTQDETFVIAALSAKGLSYDDIDVYLEKAKKIAKVEEIPLKKVLDNDYFKSFEKAYQDNRKIELASVGASKGSGGAVTKKTLQTPNLSDDDFNAMLRKKVLG